LIAFGGINESQVRIGRLRIRKPSASIKKRALLLIIAYLIIGFILIRFLR
jgi:hypothetical protein